LKHTCEDYESRWDPEWEWSKLVYCIVPNKTKKCSEGRSNRDVKVRLLSEEVQSLILKGAIERVQDPFQSPVFYSRLILVPKKTVNRQCVQMSYYCLKHTCEDYESRWDPEWECSKLVYCIVPNKTKKCSEGRSNRDVKVRIYEIEVCCPHTRVDTRPDGIITDSWILSVISGDVIFSFWGHLHCQRFPSLCLTRLTKGSGFFCRRKFSLWSWREQ
jgi:hypothetical protein